MVAIKRITQFMIITSLLFLSQACIKHELEVITTIEEEIQNIYSGFEFKTINEYDIKLRFFSNQNQPLKGVYVELFTSNPLNNIGTLTTERKKQRIFAGNSNTDGILNFKINIPSFSDSLYVLTYYIGLPTITGIKLSNEQIELNIGGQFSSNSTKSASKYKSGTIPTPSLVNGYYVLGSWNIYGVPDYLEPVDDVISADFLNDVNASLPERVQLPNSHPQYLANSNDASLSVLENCNVWVTFVHEGAGWHNTLGYYTYSTDNPPTSQSDINDLTIIFPDVSKYSNGLASGNKVQLFYLNTETNEYSSTFPAGTSVGWFLIAQGWSSSSQTVTNGVYRHFSNIVLNVESDADLKKHNVLLYDDARELLLLGFEDIRRDNSGCDHDFNDAVFYATVNPITAVDNSIYQPIDNPIDSDNDGTSDVFDEFPNDPNKAFNNYYPSQGKTGTLVFEDLWPHKGDYDFNDLVVDYNFNQITNSQNEVTSINSKIIVRAIGASYHNAFGISLNTTPGNILSVSGQLNTKGYLNIASNGTENNQTKAVIIFFDDAYNALPYPGTGLYVNTLPENPYVTPDTLFINIDFVNPVAFNNIGTPPYNPFIIINRNRGVEVHLPNLEPTDLANLDLLGTGDDNSDIALGKYYVSDIYLPWAINLPESFDYPSEKHDITQTHLMFNPWAISLGYNYMDWYMPKTAYRNLNKIFNH